MDQIIGMHQAKKTSKENLFPRRAKTDVIVVHGPQCKNVLHVNKRNTLPLRFAFCLCLCYSILFWRGSALLEAYKLFDQLFDTDLWKNHQNRTSCGLAWTIGSYVFFLKTLKRITWFGSKSEMTKTAGKIGWTGLILSRMEQLIHYQRYSYNCSKSLQYIKFL